MSPQKKSSRAQGGLRVIVLGIALEEGTRLVRKYGPGVLDKTVEAVIEKGPPLAARGWETVKTQAPPAAGRVKDGTAAAGRWAVRGAKSLRRTKKGDQEGTEVASPRVSEDGPEPATETPSTPRPQ
jgi:hypothetical protein